MPLQCINLFCIVFYCIIFYYAHKWSFCFTRTHTQLWAERVKSKFHYADFATKSGTSSRQSRGLVADTNHESLRHKSRRRLSWFASATSPRLCRELVLDFVADFVADFPPWIKFHYSDTNGFVTDLSRTLSQTSRHVEMICVRNFRDLYQQISPKLYGFMICHRLCPRLSWFVSTTFPTGKFRWKLA